MDFTKSKLVTPDLSLNFVPIYWEPYAGSGEKIVALIATKPRLESAKHASPKAYSVLSEKRLTAMMGKTRGASAHAILNESATYLTSRLEAGLDLNDALPPFAGFSVGVVRRSSGWNLKQVIESAVRSVAAFGNIDELFVDQSEISRHTTTTREFLKRLQKSEFGVVAKDRFNKKLRVSIDAPEITIDYCYKDLLVQATSLPSSKYQESDLEHEVKSKLYDILSLQRLPETIWKPKLFLNVEALENTISAESKAIAKKAHDAIAYDANSQNVEVITVHSTEEAADKLATLS
jgi:hypothetical protein